MSATKEKLIKCFCCAAFIRYLLMSSEYQKTIADRVEVSTALNSWKRVTEGVHLYESGIDPYSGDTFHETPLNLITFRVIQTYLSPLHVKFLFVVLDLLTAVFLAFTAKHYAKELIEKEKQEKIKFKKKNDEDKRSSVFETIESKSNIVLYVTAAYLFNPYSVLNCVGLTTTVFTNLLFSITLFAMTRRSLILSSVTVSLLTLQEFYPASLMVPVTIYFVREKAEGTKLFWSFVSAATFLGTLSGLFYASYCIMGSWNFLRSTTGFILVVPDLRPNIGIYWYFFTEMFEHFKWLFIATLQLNVSIIYVAPLALKFRQDPMLVSYAYLAIIAIFKSYPCIGDIGFYLSLLPMWKHLFRYMQQGFYVGCFMLFCTVFAPTVWHQWIYSQSANANFYFGVTLFFVMAQIFLFTDILFASVKREFAIQHGDWKKKPGTKIDLE